MMGIILLIVETLIITEVTCFLAKEPIFFKIKFALKTPCFLLRLLYSVL